MRRKVEQTNEETEKSDEKQICEKKIKIRTNRLDLYLTCKNKERKETKANKCILFIISISLVVQRSL